MIHIPTRFFQFVNEGSPDEIRQSAIAIVFVGLANAGALGVINSATEAIQSKEGAGRHALLLLMLIAIYSTSHYRLIRTMEAVETLLGKTRKRIVAKVRRCEPLALEEIGPSTIHGVLSRELTTISQFTFGIIAFFQALSMAVCILVYIATVSTPAFVLSLGMLAIAVFLTIGKDAELRLHFIASATKENEFSSGVDGLLSGFKEVQLNERRGDAVIEDLQGLSDGVGVHKKILARHFGLLFAHTQLFFFMMIGALIFLVPKYYDYDQVITKSIASIIFLMAPMISILTNYPTLTMIDKSLAFTQELEERLDGIARPGSAVSRPPRSAFRTIQLERVGFSYHNSDGDSLFTVGPIDLEIASGETIFLVGGNGSGKSTLMMLIAGLYPPQRGVIRVDGKKVDEASAVDYRSLFAGVLADFHIFPKLYGIEPDEQRVEDLLTRFEIRHKTALAGGAWTTTDLSAGQRKRLALIIAELEDRPILLLDEWGADQDPGFRKDFYERMIPELRERGKTIIAATHDDRYFGVADRILELRDGRIVSS